MTSSLLEQAERLAGAATSGPWIVPDGGPINRVYSDYELIAACENAAVLQAPAYDPRWDPHIANAAFIAWSREGVPALVSLAKEKDAEIERLREALEQALWHIGTDEDRNGITGE